MGDNQPRDNRGRFASSDNSEVAARNRHLLGFGSATPTPTKQLSRAAQERQAILKGVDARFGRRNVSH